MSEQLRFYKVGENEAGDPVYRMVFKGEAVRDGLTLDEVIREITRRDEEKLGEEHAGGGGL